MGERHKPWQYFSGFAVLGFAVTVAGYLYHLYVFNWSSPSGLDTAVNFTSIILCPPLLLFWWCPDCEVGTNAGVLMYSVSALLNAVLYGAIGAWFGRRWRKSPITTLS